MSAKLNTQALELMMLNEFTRPVPSAHLFVFAFFFSVHLPSAFLQRSQFRSVHKWEMFCPMSGCIISYVGLSHSHFHRLASRPTRQLRIYSPFIAKVQQRLRFGAFRGHTNPFRIVFGA